jgi:hypothetical protein
LDARLNLMAQPQQGVRYQLWIPMSIFKTNALTTMSSPVLGRQTVSPWFSLASAPTTLD